MKRHMMIPVLLVLAGCNAPEADVEKSVQVVASTPIVGNIAQSVAGRRARVTTLIPRDGDPHSYEPTLRDVRAVAMADLVLTNGLLLEEQRLTRTVEANLAPKARHVPVAEHAPRYGARLIPLTEDISLATIWLGMRVEGRDEEGSTVTIRALAAEGPGKVAAFLTGTFGQSTRYIDSSDGINETDKVELPPDAHTHMSWAFSQAGIYRLTLEAAAQTSSGEKILGKATYTFAVGTAVPKNLIPLSQGHMDITASFLHGLKLRGDSHEGEKTTKIYDPSASVIVVPDVALADIPANPSYRFLGKPGEETYLLAQAVLGKHVHGDIDPHMWLDPSGGQAYTKVIRDALIAQDPAGKDQYEKNAARYLERLKQAEEYMDRTLRQIPQENRHLITTHDGFGYLAQPYGLKVAGFVAPSAGVQPSAREAVALRRTIRTLGVPAVFIEPNVAAHSAELVEAAHSGNVRVCRLYSEVFDANVPDYLALITTNAYNLAACLNPGALPPPKYQEDK